MKIKWVLIIIPLLIVLSCIFYIVYKAPYNLQDRWHKNSLGVIGINSFNEIEELSQYFKGDKIKKVKYIGSNTYEVLTNKGEYIVVADYTDRDFWKYKIFKYDRKVEYFRNPM